MSESYEVRFKYFDPQDNYWKYDSVIVSGFHGKSEHKKAKIKAGQILHRKGYKHVEVLTVIYV